MRLVNGVDCLPGLDIPHAVTPIAEASITAKAAHSQSDPLTVMVAFALEGLASSAPLAARTCATLQATAEA